MNDLSTDEQIYLYEKIRELKQAVTEESDLSRFQIADKNVGAYLIFLEEFN